ncbi:MAG TPA: MFS transporter [Candidatus Binataceae bacterium]|nr:MFS transporter [Candidatus Binataceae bacterium]
MRELTRARLRLMASVWAVIILVFSPAINAIGIYLLPLAREFHAGRSQVSLVAAAMAVAMGVGAPAAGWLLDRMEVHWLMAAGIVITDLGYLLGSRVGSLNTLCLAFALVGIGLAACTLVPIWVVVLAWFKHRRGLALGLAVSGISVGYPLFPLVAAHLLPNYGWRTVMRWTVVPSLLIALPMVLAWIRRHPPGEMSVQAGEELDGVSARTALLSGAFLAIAIMHMSIILAWDLFRIHLVAYLVGTGFSERVADSLLGLQGGFAIVGFLFNGWLADRFGPRSTMVVGFITFGLGLFCLRLTHPSAVGWVLMVIFMVCYANAGGLGNFTSLIVVNTMGPRALGTLLGVLSFLGSTLCQSSAPVISGKIYDYTGSYALVFDLAGVLIAVGLIATALIRPLRDLQPAPAEMHPAAAAARD